MTEARKDRRAPASIKVKYKSANMSEFVELVGGDVSRGGIFVKTKKPLEPGALLKFEFQLQGGEPMIYGVGRVAWRRTEDAAKPTLPAGMGIKFIKLNGQSRLVIERIEAKHGPGSRFEQTDGAEVATSNSSAPPSGLSQIPSSTPPSATLITPLRPEATRAAAEADALAAPRLPSMQSSFRSSPPLREARTSGPKALAGLTPTFRPPPPASDSKPPQHASSNPPRRPSLRPTSSSGAFGLTAPPPAAAGSQPPAAIGSSSSGAHSLGSGNPPRGVLGSGAPGRRAVSTRSAARDASEFLASAFSVGGAGREVRSEAHAQVERARHDPRSVDLANELFGDLNATRADADAALDADPMLAQLGTQPANTPIPEGAVTARPLPGPDESAPASPRPERPRTSPKPAAANDQLSLKLGGVSSKPPAARSGRPASSSRGLWFAAIAVLGLAGGASVYYLQQPVAQPAPPPAASPVAVAPPASPQPAAAVIVDFAISSEPAGAELKVDGAPSGKTPTTLKLAQGKTVQLSLRSPGYATKVESVTVDSELPSRSVTLDPLPYELVVSEPVGATIKVLDKSVEAPAPLELGALFSVGTGSGEDVTVTIDKPGFQRVTRKLTRADFREQGSVLRAELSVPLVAAGPGAKAAAPLAKAPAAKLAAPAAAPAPRGPVVLLKEEPPAPPEPEAAPKQEAAPKPEAPAPVLTIQPEKPAAAPPAPAPTPGPETQAHQAPAPAPSTPAPATQAAEASN